LTDKTPPILKPIQMQFRAAKSLCQRISVLSLQPQSATVTASDAGDGFFKKSYAQVETLVLPQAVIPKSCGLKPRKKRPSPLTIRASESQKDCLRQKARAAGISLNRFALASALGSYYKPPADPGLIRVLLKISRELTAQGNNLNQIAKHLNSGTATAQQGQSLLDVLGRSLLRTHKSVRDALAHGERGPMP
jgi:hypothetical protein